MVQKAVLGQPSPARTFRLQPCSQDPPSQVHLGEGGMCVDLGVIQTLQLWDLRQKHLTCMDVLSVSVKWELFMNISELW